MAQGILGHGRSYLSTATGPLGGGSLDEDMPEWRGVTLDPKTSSIIDQKANAANKTDQEIAADRMNGVNRNLETSHFGDFSNQLGGAGDPAMAEAIRQRAERHFGSDLNKLQRQTEIEAPMSRAASMSMGMNALTQQQQLNNRINQAQIQSDYNKKQLRNAVISNIFGAGGTVAGIYTAGASQRAANRNQQKYDAVKNSGSNPSIYNSTEMDANQDYNNIG